MRELWDSERDPLASLAKGAPELFEQFVAVETGSFVSFFRRLGADPEEAEDLTQDLFLKLYSQADHYVPRERFAPYAFRVARNAWIDRARRQTTRGKSLQTTGGTEDGGDSRYFFEGTPSSDSDAASKAVSREESHRLHVALASLSAMHRAVFEFGVLQELSYSEVSELLGVPEGTVKSRMFYAVRRLRELLEEDPACADSEPDDRSEIKTRSSQR